VHIRYFAVRDEAGTYQGTLEVTQDSRGCKPSRASAAAGIRQKEKAHERSHHARDQDRGAAGGLSAAGRRPDPAVAALQGSEEPILRKTVAKVATLERASQMSGVPVRRLVSALREASACPGTSADLDRTSSRPPWIRRARVVRRGESGAPDDADDLLAKGEVPLRACTRPRERSGRYLLCVKSAFRPAPLLEASTRPATGPTSRSLTGHLPHVRVPQGSD